jgi:hypothetical protein
MERLTADQRAVSYLIQNNLGDIMLTHKGEEKCYASDAMVKFASQEVAAEKQRWINKIQKEIDEYKRLSKIFPEGTGNFRGKISEYKKLLEGEK